jgi:hypothetical protein
VLKKKKAEKNFKKETHEHFLTTKKKDKKIFKFNVELSSLCGISIMQRCCSFKVTGYVCDGYVSKNQDRC